MQSSNNNFDMMTMMSKMSKGQIDDKLLAKINNVKPDLIFAEKLYGAYGGEYGELSAITQYIYEQMVLEDEVLGSAIRKIAITEMMHLNILGKLLNKLGLIPFFKGSQNNIWSGDEVKYRYNSLRSMFDYNIKIEEIAIEEYKRLITLTNDTNIIDIFESILSDERTHLAEFEALKRKYVKD